MYVVYLSCVKKQSIVLKICLDLCDSCQECHFETYEAHIGCDFYIYDVDIELVCYKGRKYR